VEAVEAHHRSTAPSEPPVVSTKGSTPQYGRRLLRYGILIRLMSLVSQSRRTHPPASSPHVRSAPKADIASRHVSPRDTAPVAICSRRGHGLRDRYTARDVEPQGRDHSGHQRERCQCIESAGEAASYVFDPTDDGRPKKAT